MAYTLNTSHALYPNIVEMIGVEGGNLVSLKTARTFTKHAEASYGTGTYGEHFRTVGGGFTVKGASFTPAVSINTVTYPNATVVIVLNSISSVGGGGQRNMFGSTTTAAGAFALGMTSAGVVTGLENWNTLRSTGTADLDTPSAPHMLAAVKVGETAHKIYVDGSFNVDSATRLAYNTATGANWDYIGGATGQGSCAEDVVWLIWFNKALSEAELDEIYSSLGASNSISLLSAGSSNGTGQGSPNYLTLSYPSASAVGTGGSSTNGSSSGSPAGISLSSPSASAVGTTAGTGTLTTPVLKNNTGTILANQTGITVNVYDISSGELILHKTGQTSNASGVVIVTDAALIPSTSYAYEVVLSTARRLPTGTVT